MSSPTYIAGPTDSRERLGGKGAALAALAATDLPIPAWFVVAPEALDASLPDAARGALAGAHDAATAAAALADISSSATVAAEVSEALDRLGEGFFAVRSSAVAEDGPMASFAGQLESYLFVPREQVLARVIDVWRSGFTERVYAYHTEHGLGGPPRAPAVLVQRMVDADAAGVAFSADPVTSMADVAVVSAVLGSGSALVSGDADADVWHVSDNGEILSASVVTKSSADRPAPGASGGISSQPVPPEQSRAPSLTDAQVREVAALSRAAAAHFGSPQDIEWAFEDGWLFLLQSRPITTLALAEPEGELNIWDNSNIAESYGGVTTPLTYTFALHAYDTVYQELCRILGVSEAVIEANAGTFARMLGLVRGRVYYNLLSWYRVLALLPGYKFNRRFMEQMMGVREALPEELVAEQRAATRGDRVVDFFRLARSVGRLSLNHLTLRRRIDRFYDRLEGALQPRPLDRMDAEELGAYYRELEERVLARWDAPLVNDFFAMIFFGVLTALARRWIDPETRTLQNDLLCAEGGMISTEPARRVREMALLAAASSALVEALQAAQGADLAAAVASEPAFAAAYDEYLAKFGDRCLEELKLESATLEDDPLPLLRSVGALAARLADDEQLPEAQDRVVRSAAEARVRAALAGHPLRRAAFGWVLRHARMRVRDRENLRFERTRVFGRARRIFLALGRAFVSSGVLEDPRDVFYLELDEVLGVAAGTNPPDGLAARAHERADRFARYREEPAPPARFETRGPVDDNTRFIAPVPDAVVVGDSLVGVGCCPGVVRGSVRLIVDPRRDTLARGEILVAERTDPGWIMLFPSASGILVERGSLLSHSAIVAREMGIPAVVSLPGLTGWLKTGDVVQLDGTTGTVVRIESDSEEAAVV